MLNPQSERRAPNRPKDGDRQLCAFCRVGSMQFHEQPVPDATPGPAWICESPECGYHTLVRRTDRRAEQRSQADRTRALKEKSAKAHRSAMRIRARTETLLSRSEKLNTSRPPRNK